MRILRKNVASNSDTLIETITDNGIIKLAAIILDKNGEKMPAYITTPSSAIYTLYDDVILLEFIYDMRKESIIGKITYIEFKFNNDEENDFNEKIIGYFKLKDNICHISKIDETIIRNIYLAIDFVSRKFKGEIDSKIYYCV